MKIGIDIDDVITETSVALLKAIEEHGEGIDFNNPLTSKKEILRGKAATPEVKTFFREYGTEACSGLDLKEGADIVIRALKESGIEIHLITARDESLMQGITEATIKYLSEKEIPYDQLHIGIHNKKELCEKLGVTCLIDDSIDTCKSLLGSNIRPMLFTTPINEEFDAIGIQRVANWGELKEVIISLLYKDIAAAQGYDR